MHNLETAAGFTRIAGGIIENFLHQIKFGGMSQHDISAKLGEQFNNRLRQRKRFSVGPGVSPRHNYFLALDVTFLLDAGHEVGHSLAWVVDIALHVDDRHAGVFGYVAQVLIAVTPIAMADGDAVSIRGENLTNLFRCVTVRNLHFVGFEENSMSPQARHTRLK